MTIAVEGKVVVVTGAARGIGRVLIEAFTSEGAKVVASDINAAQLETTREELYNAGLVISTCPANVVDEDEVTALMATAAREFGRIDGLVNNAGIYDGLASKSAASIPSSRWQNTMNVNVWGTMLCSRAALPFMRGRGGSIVNVSSTTALLGASGLSDYVASKAAVIGLTRSLAREFGDEGLTVNAVAPGGTWTQATRGRFRREDGSQDDREPEVIRAAAIAGQAIKRQLQPEDLIGPVTFLLSDSAAMMTGQVLVVDGGAIMG